MFRNLFTFKRLFDFKGRATRRELLLFHGIWMATMFAPLGFVRSEGATGGLFLFVICLGLVPSLALNFRRLHDQGNSAWFLLLAAVPVVGWAFLLFMLFYPGQSYENEYGPDPREEHLIESGLAV